ncbi:helix-turn-helix transcriptional regulator [Paenibacillus senegalensis]|uniref:helix-turn-helix transcriptional regulator n=1 Tax=Paenibacillus senegalensis TaxID=1465766 RepID=UPI0002884155|nr:helix-turn-helix transcriptional regulator [Paenibacillus senegalensis]
MQTLFLKNPVPDSFLFRQQALITLRGLLPFEAACFTTVDPRSLLSTGAVTDDRIERIHPALFKNEYLATDYNKYMRLATSDSPIAVLSVATKGKLERSARYKEILLPAGFGDELRAALVWEGKCWGFLTLFRSEGHAHFSSEDIRRLSEVLPAMARSLKQFACNWPLPAPNSVLETGIMIVDEQCNLLSANASGKRLLHWLRQMEQLAPPVLPRPIRAVCSKAKSGNPDSPIQTNEARLCVFSPDGFLLSIQATQMHAESAQFAVIGEQAQPQELLNQMLDFYRLSARETELLRLLVQGYSTKQLSETLSISAYTVQDHLKSIFAKTGVSSRRELIGLLLSPYNISADL